MTVVATSAEALALHGGPKAVSEKNEGLFRWPIVTKEDEDAVLEVLRRGAMSGTEITQQFEKEYAAWHGVEHALAHVNGTASLHAALFACGVGEGDEVICPSLTFWASVTGALNLGASIHFCDVKPDSVTIDPADIEHRIGPRTKAIVVVHYSGYPADMDPVMAIARKHKLKVVEDVSHAHGGLYKGRLVGTIGDAAGMSLMSGKALVCGEGGMLLTHDRAIFERAVAFAHYERTRVGSAYYTGEPYITAPELQKYAGIPLGGFKYRLNQLCSAMGRVQLRHYHSRMLEIQRGMNRFWDLIEAEDLPGVHPHRPAKDSGSTMGGWYQPLGLYREAELDGFPIARFCEALSAEGVGVRPGANFPLHLHPLYNEADIYGTGKPTNVAHAERDVRQKTGSLPMAEKIPASVFCIPWFKHDDAEAIAAYAKGVIKVVRAIERGELQA